MNLPDKTATQGIADAIPLNPAGGCVGPNGEAAICDFPQGYPTAFVFLLPSTFTFFINGSTITAQHEGWWVIQVRVKYVIGFDANVNPVYSAPYTKSFILKVNLAPQVLSAPLTLQSDFEGTTLQSSPEPLPEEESIEPYISEVSSDGVIELGFPEPMTTTSE